MLKITLPRGDLQTIFFDITFDDGSEVGELDEIYFTVKRSYTQSSVLFQKRQSDGGICKTGDASYKFVINPADTDNLDFGTYVFDIELVAEGRIKSTFVGDLNLTKEVTFAGNEG